MGGYADNTGGIYTVYFHGTGSTSADLTNKKFAPNGEIISRLAANTSSNHTAIAGPGTEDSWTKGLGIVLGYGMSASVDAQLALIDEKHSAAATKKRKIVTDIFHALTQAKMPNPATKPHYKQAIKAIFAALETAKTKTAEDLNDENKNAAAIKLAFNDVPLDENDNADLYLTVAMTILKVLKQNKIATPLEWKEYTEIVTNIFSQCKDDNSWEKFAAALQQERNKQVNIPSSHKGKENENNENDKLNENWELVGAEEEIQEKLDALGDLSVSSSPKIINIVGWSRGGVKGILLAHALFKKYDDNVKVNLFAVDPVPGPMPEGTYNDERYYTLPPNVLNYQAVYAQHEWSKGFEAVIPKPQGQTNVNITVLPGHHATLAGSPFGHISLDPIKNETTQREYDLSAVGTIVRVMAEEFLLTHGTKLEPVDLSLHHPHLFDASKEATQTLRNRLALYNSIQTNIAGYKQSAYPTYTTPQVFCESRYITDNTQTSGYWHGSQLHESLLLTEDYKAIDAGFVNNEHKKIFNALPECVVTKHVEGDALFDAEILNTSYLGNNVSNEEDDETGAVFNTAKVENTLRDSSSSPSTISPASTSSSVSPITTSDSDDVKDDSPVQTQVQMSRTDQMPAEQTKDALQEQEQERLKQEQKQREEEQKRLQQEQEQEQKRAEQERLAEEQKQRAEEEQKRLQQEQEQERLKQEQKQREEEQKRLQQEQEQKRAEQEHAEQQRLAEEQKQREQEQKRLQQEQEQKREEEERAEQERKREEEERAEQERKREEEERAEQEHAEQQRLAEEQKQREQEQKRLQQEQEQKRTEQERLKQEQKQREEDELNNATTTVLSSSSTDLVITVSLIQPAKPAKPAKGKVSFNESPQIIPPSITLPVIVNNGVPSTVSVNTPVAEPVFPSSSRWQRHKGKIIGASIGGTTLTVVGIALTATGVLAPVGILLGLKGMSLIASAVAAPAVFGVGGGAAVGYGVQDRQPKGKGNVEFSEVDENEKKKSFSAEQRNSYSNIGNELHFDDTAASTRVPVNPETEKKKSNFSKLWAKVMGPNKTEQLPVVSETSSLDL